MRLLGLAQLILLITIGFSLNSCKKSRFENFNNEVIIDLPSDCEDCSLVLYSEGSDLTTVYPAAGNVYTFDDMSYVNYLPNEDNEFTVEIDWEDVPSTYADPMGEVTLALIKDLYNLGEGRVVLYSKTTKMKPRKVYRWNPANDSFEPTGDKTDRKENSSSGGSNPLVGKWMETGACANVNGESNYIEFYSNGSGRTFSADCNSMCANYGVFFGFNYVDNGSSFSVTFTSVSDYCGASGNIPAGGTSNYVLSGNVLTINGVDHIKQ